MKERPIIFSGTMVRAILEDRKTQTRRIVKCNTAGRVQLGKRNWHVDDPEAVGACPYGRTGDRLWVKETFAIYDGDQVEYRASPICGGEPDTGWRPSIFMPRWASRLTLEVVDGRTERVHDISEPDCISEGIYNGEYEPGIADGGKPGWCYAPNQFAGTARHAFELLWKSINGTESWDANPLVWAITFRRVQ